MLDAFVKSRTMTSIFFQVDWFGEITNGNYYLDFD